MSLVTRASLLLAALAAKRYVYHGRLSRGPVLGGRASKAGGSVGLEEDRVPLHNSALPQSVAALL